MTEHFRSGGAMDALIHKKISYGTRMGVNEVIFRWMEREILGYKFTPLHPGCINSHLDHFQVVTKQYVPI